LGFLAAYLVRDLPFLVGFALVLAAVIAFRLLWSALGRLRRDGSSTRSGEGARELDEDGQVGMERDPIQPTDAKRK
jgi:hypothetical protein